ncbi:MAG TPA: hypothetical protein VGP82_10580 [Ktedonobacterales bacterium]|jgi:hypothetical protein|nr:hypothetical protein [Ktedonobacterales bacterium]
MTLRHACVQKHTLINIVGSLWICECPQLYKLVGKYFLDPARVGLLEDCVSLCGGVDAIRQMARTVEKAEAAKKKPRKPR